jgi:hypothetical protein
LFPAIPEQEDLMVFENFCEFLILGLFNFLGVLFLGAFIF